MGERAGPHLPQEEGGGEEEGGGSHLLCASAMAHAFFSASRLEKKYGSTVSVGTIDQSASVKMWPTPRSMGLQQWEGGGGMWPAARSMGLQQWEGEGGGGCGQRRAQWDSSNRKWEVV